MENKWIDMVPGVRRRTLCAGTQAMQMEVEFAAGTRLPEHAHPHEQIVHVLSGRLRLTVAGVLHELTPGQSLLLTGGVVHGAEALEETRVLDTFSPPRADLLAQDALP